MSNYYLDEWVRLEEPSEKRVRIAMGYRGRAGFLMLESMTDEEQYDAWQDWHGFRSDL